MLELPYALQEKYSTEPLDVVVEWKKGKIKTVAKMASEMSASDVKLVFDGGRIRTLDQQAWRLDPQPEEKPSNIKPVATKRSEPSPMRDIGFFDITFSTDGEMSICKSKENFATGVVLLMKSGKNWVGKVHIKIC